MSNSVKPPASEVDVLREQFEDLRCALLAVILILALIVGAIVLQTLNFSSSESLALSLSSAAIVLLVTVPLFIAALCSLFSKSGSRGPSVVYEDQEG